MSDFNVDTASRPELEAVASDLGVKYQANTSDDTLRKRIREALGEPQTLSAEQPTKEKGKKVEIIVATHERDKQPVQVGVNGKMYLIKRGEKVIVPAKVCHALDLAVEYQYDPGSMERREVPRFPYQRLREL